MLLPLFKTAWSIPTHLTLRGPAVWHLTLLLGTAPLSDLPRGLGEASILHMAPLTIFLQSNSLRLFRLLILLSLQGIRPWSTLCTQ